MTAITNEIPTFLDGTAPVELVTHLVGYERQENTVILDVGCKRYEPVLQNYYGTVCETVIDPPSEAGQGMICLEFLTDEICRLRYAPGELNTDQITPMVVGKFKGNVDLKIIEGEDTLQIETHAIRMLVAREPWRIEIFDLEGNKLWSTRPVDIPPLRRAKEQWNPPQQRWLFLHRYAYPWGSRPGENLRAFASFDLHPDEHIYGLGEDFGPVDKRGVHRRLWLQEGFGNASPASYKQTPFYMSTRGYGIFVNTSNAISFRVGELDHSALSIILEDTTELDFYWIYGPALKDILPRYTALTGVPTVPPKWSFGLWMGRITYNRQDQVERIAEEVRHHRIPCDLIHIDTGWYEKEWECDYCFGPDKFPDPVGMLDRMRESGFRVSLWQWPNMTVGSEIFSEGQTKGYFARRANGKTYTYPGFLEDTALIDYSNPEAVAWVQEKIRNLLEMGVAVIKVDFGEGAPPDAKYHSIPSVAMHNLYPLLYSRAMYEVTEQVHGEGQALLWARAAWAGSQRYPVHWSGDGVARFNDLACVLRSALSFGMSGFPFYSHDIGGFSGIPSPELYVRWAQFGLFSSHARCHGEPPREPWAYGEQAETIFRQYTELRYRLMPYIYSQAVECGRTSLPMVRALVLEFQDDPVAAMITDQYMFGRHILVAPILDETNTRRVYLPSGTWMDYWTKDTLQGPCWLSIEASLDILPLYIQSGAILPFGPLSQFVDEKPLDPLTLEIYTPSSRGEFTIFDPNLPELEVNYDFDGHSLRLETSQTPGLVDVILYGVEIVGVHVDGIDLPFKKTGIGGWEFRYDGRTTAGIEVIVKEN